MLSSNGTYATIKYFLQIIKAQSPEILPNIYMTDRDQAQVKAIRATYPGCPGIVLLVACAQSNSDTFHD
jgi:hypothetical protein